MDNSVADPRGWIEKLVNDFWAMSPENNIGFGSTEKAWDTPLVGYAAASDPLFARYAEDLAPFYWTPRKAFQLAFPEETASDAELSIISWVLPQTTETKKAQAACTELPSENWARTRDFGERFNCALRLHLADKLTVWLPGGRPGAPARLRLPALGAFWHRLQLVRTPHRPRRRARHFRPLRRVDYPGGQGGTVRFGGGEDHAPPQPAQLRRTPRLVPVVRQGNLRRLCETLSGRRDF